MPLKCATRNGTAGVFRPASDKPLTHPRAMFVGSPQYVSPKTDHTIPVDAPIGQQGDIGSCTTFATKGAVLILTLLLGVDFPALSEKHMYLLERDRLGAPNEDCGGYSQECVAALATTGVCSEDVWPWTNSIVDATGKAERPPIDALRDAASNRIPAIDWAEIRTLDALEQSIRANHPVIFGTEVDSTIWEYTPDQVLTAPNTKDIIGGHEMVVVGVRFVDGARQWKLRNSWGGDWGDAGHLWVDDAFMGNPSIAGSMFALLNLPHTARA